jgi:hypothetical protein
LITIKEWNIRLWIISHFNTFDEDIGTSSKRCPRNAVGLLRAELCSFGNLELLLSVSNTMEISRSEFKGIYRIGISNGADGVKGNQLQNKHHVLGADLKIKFRLAIFNGLIVTLVLAWMTTAR